jgi:hypothetical protein
MATSTDAGTMGRRGRLPSALASSGPAQTRSRINAHAHHLEWGGSDAQPIRLQIDPLSGDLAKERGKIPKRPPEPVYAPCHHQSLSALECQTATRKPRTGA